MRKPYPNKPVFPRPARQKNPSRGPNSWLAIRAERSTSFIKILLNILIFIVFLAFAFSIAFIAKEFNHNEIILDAVVVPEDLVKSGYTGTVVAGKLLDAAREIGFEVEKSSRDKSWHKETENIREMKVEAHMPDIQVPGAGFTLRSLLRYVRQIFGFKSPYSKIKCTTVSYATLTNWITKVQHDNTLFPSE